MVYLEVFGNFPVVFLILISSLNSFSLENTPYMISIFKRNFKKYWHLFYGPGHHLSILTYDLRTLEKNVHSAIVRCRFYKCQLYPAGWQCFEPFISLMVFCLVVLLNSIEVSNYKCIFIHFSFHFNQFLFHIFCSSIVDVYTFNIVIPYW